MDKNSMLYWWPKTKDTQVPKPKTIIIEIGHRPLLEMLDGKPLPEAVKARITAAAEQLGYPLFVRTDKASGKHNWENSCYVASPDKLWSNIYRIVEFNEMADILGLAPEALVFRRYIPLKAPFKAFYGKMPVAQERRYFVQNGKVECHHPYWLEDAIDEWWERAKNLASVRLGKIEPLPKDWRKMLADLNKETQEEVDMLTTYAEEIGRAIGAGYWSIDFAKGQDGTWYFIDMAEGERSWHLNH